MQTQIPLKVSMLAARPGTADATTGGGESDIIRQRRRKNRQPGIESPVRQSLLAIGAPHVREQLQHRPFPAVSKNSSHSVIHHDDYYQYPGGKRFRNPTCLPRSWTIC